MDRIWNYYFPLLPSYSLFTGTISQPLPSRSNNYFLFNVNCISLSETAIFLESNNGNMLISDSNFESIITNSLYGAICYNSSSDFIIQRSCAYMCSTNSGSYHFYVSEVKNDNNRNWLLDSSISWCGKPELKVHCITRQYSGDVMNTRVNVSFCTSSRHAGLSLYHSPVSRSAFLTISHNNSTEGRFYHIVSVNQSYVQYSVFDSNFANKNESLFHSGSPLRIRNCVFARNVGKLITCPSSYIISGCVVEDSPDTNTNGVSFVSPGSFALDDFRLMHYARRRCQAENPIDWMRMSRRRNISRQLIHLLLFELNSLSGYCFFNQLITISHYKKITIRDY